MTYKMLRISETRDDPHYLNIDADNTHFSIATIAVRMAGDDEDKPELVQFAHELVERYNSQSRPSGVLDVLTSDLQGAKELLQNAIDTNEKLLCNESSMGFFLRHISHKLLNKNFSKKARIKSVIQAIREKLAEGDQA